MRTSRYWLYCAGLATTLIVALVVLPIWRRTSSANLSPSPTTAALSGNPFLPKDVPDEGWPFIRGQTYDGQSPEVNLADHWPEQGPPVLWSRSLGQGYSAFVARGDRVYTQVQTLGGQSVVCLQADSGETIWEYHYDWPYDAAGVYPGPRATPTLYGGCVYFAAPNGLIGCLGADSGHLVWSINVLEKYQGRGVDFGYSCSPTVLEGRVLLPVGGRDASLVALSASDGAELWRAGSDSASYTPAYPIAYRGRQLVIGYLENALVVCDRATGELIGRQSLSHGYDEHSAWPIYREPELWLSGPFRSGSSLAELRLDSEPGNGVLRPIWSNELLSNDVMSSVLVGEHIYGFDIRDAQAKTHRTSRGVFRCLEWSSGKSAWSVGDERQQKMIPPAIGHAAVIVADGKLLLLNDTGELILARVNPQRYEELARVAVLPGEIGWTPPTLHRGRVYMRNHSRAVCVYVGRSDLLEKTFQSTATTIAELPQSWHLDWTHVVLPIEPEYAFDIPGKAWLTNWFAWSAGLLALAWIAAGLVHWVGSVAGWLPDNAFSAGPAYAERTRTLAFVLAMIAGALGTTLLSYWRNDFIFTWQLSLYAAFYLGALSLPLTRRRIDSTVRRRSLLGMLLIAVSGGLYFWLCRRLSLVFEWAFLAGYLPALGAVLLDHGIAARAWRQSLKCWAMALTSLLGFAAFYAAGVALLWLRYR